MDQPKEWIVIADSHLGAGPGDLEPILALILKTPAKERGLIFFGDLFHIWAGPRKFHTLEVSTLMAALTEFQGRGGQVRLVMGNRDALLEETQLGGPGFEGLPFDRIAQENDQIETPSGSILLAHGDLVNQLDQRYLRWRAVYRSAWFRWAFTLLPKKKAQKIMVGLEAKLKGTNLHFKLEFPWPQWEHWLETQVRFWAPRLILVGHFHPEQLIETKLGTTTALVIPDWLNSRCYLWVKEDLSYEVCHFTP